jgi:hypothetical protein
LSKVAGEGNGSGMHRILLVLGLVVVAVGVAMVGFGIPNNEFGFGNTLVGSGTTAIVGGLILVGLSAAVRQLQDVARALEARSSFPRQAGDPSWADVQLRGGVSALAGDGAESPVRGNAFAPKDDGEGPVDRPRPPMIGDGPNPRIPESLRGLVDRRERGDKPNTTADAAPASARGDRTRDPARPVRGFDAVWPRERGVEAAPSGLTAASLDSASAEGGEAAPEVEQEQEENEQEATVRDDEEPPPVSILKSGVIDGMAYTLYSDGSIEADLPQGTVRFGTIEELRVYLADHDA